MEGIRVRSKVRKIRPVWLRRLIGYAPLRYLDTGKRVPDDKRRYANFFKITI